MYIFQNPITCKYNLHLICYLGGGWFAEQRPACFQQRLAGEVVDGDHEQRLGQSPEPYERHQPRGDPEQGDSAVSGLGGQANSVEEGQEGDAGGKAGTEGGQNVGHHNRGVRHVLAAFLHPGVGHAAL